MHSWKFYKLLSHRQGAPRGCLPDLPEASGAGPGEAGGLSDGAEGERGLCYGLSHGQTADGHQPQEWQGRPPCQHSKVSQAQVVVLLSIFLSGQFFNQVNWFIVLQSIMGNIVMIVLVFNSHLFSDVDES